MGNKLQNNISYVLQFADSSRFMASSLSNFVNNILKQIIKLNINTDTMIKDVKFDDLNIGIRTILEFKCFKDDLIECKIYQQKLEEKLKKRFSNRYRFSNYGKNKFISFLRKCFYPL